MRWLLLIAPCLLLVHYGIQSGRPILFFNFAYFGLALTLCVYERIRPFESQWLRNDGQMLPDLLHTLLTKGTAQIAVGAGVLIGVAQHSQAGAWWPQHWPVVPQIALTLVIAEFGLYWAHRLSHEWPPLWRFHALHHSVERLWFWNTGRFHPLNTLTSMAFSVPLVWLAGAPADMLTWLSAITAFIGMLTHCNVDLRSGAVSWVFNTPELHRWHHSRRVEEGNTNYGENLMLFDWLFGSYFLPDRRPPLDIGIDQPTPDTFLAQLRQPFGKIER